MKITAYVYRSVMSGKDIAQKMIALSGFYFSAFKSPVIRTYFCFSEITIISDYITSAIRFDNNTINGDNIK